MDQEHEIIEEIWIGILTGSGFHYPKPIKSTWDEETQSWFDKKGKLEVTKLGLLAKTNYISYSSTEREKVSSWMLGVRCCNQLLNNATSKAKLTFDRKREERNGQEVHSEGRW